MGIWEKNDGGQMLSFKMTMANTGANIWLQKISLYEDRLVVICFKN
jgi:hypothetical protein